MTREGDSASSDDPWIYIGRVARPHGVRGGVKIHLENPDSDVLAEGLVLRLEQPKKPAREVVVSRFYGQANVDLEGVTDRDAAEALRNAQLHVRRSDFPALDDDETYLVDLIGAEVRHADGHVLGVLESFSDNRAQPLAEVRTPADAGSLLVLVPFVPGIVTDVDEAARVVVMDPPEGLFEGDAEEVPPEGGTSSET